MTEADPRRDQIMDGLMAAVVELGYPATTVEEIVERAGVDRGTFSSFFVDKADCYAQTYQRNFDFFNSLVLGAYQSLETWPDNLRSAAYAAARYLRDYPAEVHFGVVPALEVSELVSAYRDRFFQQLVELLDAGRQELADPDSIGRGVAESTLGSIYETLVRRLREEGSSHSAEDLVPELMYLAVRPYLGHQAALEELKIPPPREP